jgi:hypothetical protein
MNFLRKWWPLPAGVAVLALILWVVLTGIKTPEAPAQTMPSTSAAPELSAAERYSIAKAAVEQAEDLMLEYTCWEVRQIGINEFSKSVIGSAAFCGVGQEDMTAMVTEELNFGTYACAYAETFCEGKAYAVINGCRFQSDLTPEAFVDRQLPAALLTASLYETLKCEEDEDTIRILFSQPTELENWAGEGKLIGASGTAVLDRQGHLLQTSYQAVYQKDGVQFRLEATVRVTVPEELDLSAVHVGHDLARTPVEDLNAPRWLVQVVANVFSAQNISCEAREQIQSDAIPLTYYQTSSIVLSGMEETLSASVIYDASLTDRHGNVTRRQQTERFADGLYTVTVDDGEPVEDSMTALAMRQYCEDTILSGLFAVKYVKTAESRTEEGLLKITFGADDAFGGELTRQLTGILQADLETMAQSAETVSASGYLTVDTKTGLPVAMGIELARNHRIDGVDYRLVYLLDETLTFGKE